MKREEGSPSQALVTAAGIASLIYFAFAARFATRIGASRVNASSRAGLVGALVVPLVLYAIAATVAYAERRRSSAPVPVVGASLFGIFVCLLFYGV